MTFIRQPLSLFFVSAIVSIVLLAFGLVAPILVDGRFGVVGAFDGGRVLTLIALVMGLLVTVVTWAVWPLLRIAAESGAASGEIAVGARAKFADAAPEANGVKGSAGSGASRPEALPTGMAGTEARGTARCPGVSAGFLRAGFAPAEAGPEIPTYKAALDQAPVAIMIFNRDRRIEYVNHAFLAEVGYERLELIGRTPRVLGAGRTRAAVYRDVWQTIAAGGVWRGEMLNRRKNGSEYWGKIAVSPLRDATLRISRFVAVCEDVTELKRREEGLHQLTRIDPLTGTSNRRHLMERARNEWTRADRYGLPLALIMLDIDHFKAVNDEYGHAVGDRAICAVATICVDCVREIDLVGRYGGEEFVIVLPGTGLEGARKLGRRLRKRIADTVLQDANGRPFKLTASLGVAELAGGISLDRLLALADSALYRAKRAGRDRVVAAPSRGRERAQTAEPPGTSY